MKRSTTKRRQLRKSRSPRTSRPAAPKKYVLFVQGAGKGAHAEDARLAASLRKELGPEYEVRFPRMPREDSPDAAAWKRRIAKEITARPDDPILVGHSAGAATLIRFLAAEKNVRRVAGVFLLAAPYCGPGGWEIEGFELPRNLQAKIPRGVPIFLYHGRDDEVVPFAHLALYAKALAHAQIRAFEGRNHQFNNDLSEVAADVRRLR